LKFAAIDIGSNAIRLLIEEVRPSSDGDLIEKVSLTRVPVRLGADTFSTGRISEEKTTQLIKAMKAFYYLMDLHQVKHYRACATSAMREASNNNLVIDRIFSETGIQVEILSGDDEANIIFSNFFAQNLNKNENCLFIDVGGGSTELTLIKKGKRIKGHSFELGTVRMLANALDKETWSTAKRWIQEELKSTDKLIAIGTGGNVNTLFKMQGKKSNEKISLKSIRAQYESLIKLSYDERILKLKLKPDRADVIVPACEIYLRLMEYAGIEEMIVPKIGLSDGMILELYNSWKKREPSKFSGSIISVDD